MKILAIIPARGGSKGVPKKNIKQLAGKPLIYYTVQIELLQEGIYGNPQINVYIN
jgi:CMP-N-acetylneuraminic acid synthetase